MEGIAVMILYLVIGFFKNRKDKMKRKKIKEDPDWDSEKKPESDIGINNILNNIFDNSIEGYEDVVNESKIIKVKEEKKKFSDNELENNLKSNFNKTKMSKNQKEVRQPIQNKLKREKKENKKSKIKFIKDRGSMKRAIILKEVLDKPLGFRK
ncbi:MAG: hypothetical protein ACJZ1Q_03305 [Candidatus Neomarinimicrobiota bacterium]|nr:hypothetical protein [Candidatus Neomarinimicrobiota bacterium]|tara:strand:+ start:698 stop:1156 length:459 start_codon:yes stop_codon:yes gene_type:complete